MGGPYGCSQRYPMRIWTCTLTQRARGVYSLFPRPLEHRKMARILEQLQIHPEFGTCGINSDSAGSGIVGDGLSEPCMVSL